MKTEKVSVFYGSAWQWNAEREQFYYHGFVKEQPDLNYRNPRVVEEMKKVLRFWLDKGAGGFRVDAVNHLFEVEDFRDEPLSGWTEDPKSYDYVRHDYTKDLVRAFCKLLCRICEFQPRLLFFFVLVHRMKYTTWCINGVKLLTPIKRSII